MSNATWFRAAVLAIGCLIGIPSAHAVIICTVTGPSSCPGLPLGGPLSLPVLATEGLSQNPLPEGALVVPGDVVLTDDSPYGDVLRFVDIGGVSLFFLLCSDQGEPEDLTCSLPFSANAQFGSETSDGAHGGTLYEVAIPGIGTVATYEIISDPVTPRDVPAPEPASLVLLGTALLGSLAARRLIAA